MWYLKIGQNKWLCAFKLWSQIKRKLLAPLDLDLIIVTFVCLFHLICKSLNWFSLSERVISKLHLLSFLCAAVTAFLFQNDSYVQFVNRPTSAHMFLLFPYGRSLYLLFS